MADWRLARNGLSAEEVEGWLHTSGLRQGRRFELYRTTPGGEGAGGAYVSGPVGELSGVTAATVDFSAGAKITGGLKLSMFPDDRLRDVPLQYLVRPIWMLEIPNGTRLEFNAGLYVWNVPSRKLTGELWDLTLGDMSYWLDTESAFWGGVSLADGSRDTDGIKNILTLAQITDHSQVVDSEHTLLGGATWGATLVQYPPQGFGFWGISQYISEENRNQPGGQFRTTTLLDVMGDLHDGIGYLPPYFNRDGQYVARPAPDIRYEPPVTVFGSGGESITHKDVTTDADLSKIANRVVLYTENPEAQTWVGYADANDSFPGHPWSHAQCGHFLTRTVSSPNATYSMMAEHLADIELAKALTYAQTIQISTAGPHPTLEPNDIIGLFVNGDPEFGVPRNFLLESATFDLWTGAMQMRGRRIYEPIATGLIEDRGLPE